MVEKKTKTLGGHIEINLTSLSGQYDSFDNRIKEYNDEIEKISDQADYKKKKDALCCFRGIDTLSAMGLILEIGDVRRFENPRKLCSYAGFDVREYSSGGKEKKFGITKMGNQRIRTIAVEACQKASCYYAISRRLKVARNGQPEKIIEIADKCMRRLRKRYFNLQNAHKHTNKIKVACAREFLCFIWAALKEVS